MVDKDKNENIDEEPIQPPGPNIKKILVIDDITYVVRSISRILRARGYYVVTAMTGKDALKKYEKYKPDLMTVDQKLPDMSGLQFVEKVRKLYSEDSVKVIFVSAVQEKEEIKKIINSGIDNYLLKPFKKDMLITAVTKLIG